MALGDERIANSQRRNQRVQTTTTAGRSDPYLMTEKSTVKRGKDTGQSTSRTFADTSGFKLDQERAKNPRNWEYWYNAERGDKPVTGTYTAWEGGKGGEKVTKSRQSQAIKSAERKANRKGEIRETELEIKAIQAETKLIKQRGLDSVPFGSTATAARIAAQRNMAGRRRGRGIGRPRGGSDTLG